MNLPSNVKDIYDTLGWDVNPCNELKQINTSADNDNYRICNKVSSEIIDSMIKELDHSEIFIDNDDEGLLPPSKVTRPSAIQIINE